MAKNKTYLIEITFRDGFTKKYLTINANNKLTNRMCNSTIFPKNSSDNLLDISVFDYFKSSQKIIKKLDKRTKEYKELYKKYKYFSVTELY